MFVADGGRHKGRPAAAAVRPSTSGEGAAVIPERGPSGAAGPSQAVAAPVPKSLPASKY